MCYKKNFDLTVGRKPAIKVEQEVYLGRPLHYAFTSNRVDNLVNATYTIPMHKSIGPRKVLETYPNKKADDKGRTPGHVSAKRV